MAFLSPAALPSFRQPSYRVLTPHTSHCKRRAARRKRIVCTAPLPATADEDAEESATSALYACVQCGATLPDTLDAGSCEECGAERVLDPAGFVDFDPSGRRPISVRLFQLSTTAWIYERGWRALFETQGFPGPDAEVGAACAHLGDAARVLDISCATGILTRRLRKRYPRVVALDYSRAMLEEAASRQAGEYVRADVVAMPFVDAAFDGIVAGAALHCWPCPQDALREVRRVLRPGGAFYATTFARDAYVGKAVLDVLPDTGSYRFFWPDELRLLCKAAGFVDVEVESVKSFVSVRCRK